MRKEIFAYKQEGVLGMLDAYPGDQRVHVTIPGRGEKDMTMAELQRLVAEMKVSDADKIPLIDVKIIDE
jgi:hypothetical protein